MNNILKSIRLDYYTLKANYKVFLLIYALAIYLALVTQPTLTIVIVVIFSAIFSGTVFSIYEKNNLCKLYGILPLGKFEVVIGRYLHALFFAIINEIVAGSLSNIISLIVNKGMGRLEFTAYMSFSFLYFCMSVGISFPIYFKYGFSKISFIITILPLYIVAITGIFISRNADRINSLKQIIQYLASNPLMIWIVGIGSGLILIIISCPLSYAFFKRKEL